MKTLTQKDMCTPMFTAALFTIAKTWKQPKCPLMDDWINKLCVCVCVCGDVIRPLKMSKSICDNMDGYEGIMLSEINKDKYHMIPFIRGI